MRWVGTTRDLTSSSRFSGFPEKLSFVGRFLALTLSVPFKSMPAPIVLVLKSSRSAAGAIASEVNRCWPGYEIAVARSLRDARDCLAARPVDWLLTGLGFDDGDALDLIREVCGQRVPKVLVHTNRCAPRALAWLLQRSPVMLPIPGTRSVVHLEQNVRAAAVRLIDADLEAIDDATQGNALGKGLRKVKGLLRRSR